MLSVARPYSLHAVTETSTGLCLTERWQGGPSSPTPELRAGRAPKSRRLRCPQVSNPVRERTAAHCLRPANALGAHAASPSHSATPAPSVRQVEGPV